jgi:uncharacterized membrane protein
MITESSTEIEAPTPVVWEVFADVQRWPEWTDSVDRIVPLDDAELQVGHRFEIKQPRLPKVVWAVTELEPGVSWTWANRSPGAATLASHELTVAGDGRTIVRQRIDQRGPVGVALGVLIRRMTRRYLDLEGHGLKARSEQQFRDAAHT